MTGVAHGSPDGPKKIFGKDNVNWSGPKKASSSLSSSVTSTPSADTASRRGEPTVTEVASAFHEQ